ncbi:MAG: hypothetical protein KatS3mg014_1628 [Actinomycetota bacterium]|nr:MAG: hypothetical protein KatS3mg014_1628 [Actinomycetota bacterium]
MPPCASTMRTASSTAHSSWGLTVQPENRVSISCSSGVSVIFPPVVGTRFTQTSTFTASPHAFIRAFSGSNRGRFPTTATVTGYRSPKYSTASCAPSWACSRGR